MINPIKRRINGSLCSTQIHSKNQVHLLLYYYCLCKSFNELFHLLQDNFVPESGCKGIKKINNTQAFLRKISTKIATFFLFLQKEHKISKYTLFIYMSLFLLLKATKTILQTFYSNTSQIKKDRLTSFMCFTWTLY